VEPVDIKKLIKANISFLSVSLCIFAPFSFSFFFFFCLFPFHQQDDLCIFRAFTDWLFTDWDLCCYDIPFEIDFASPTYAS